MMHSVIRLMPCHSGVRNRMSAETMHASFIVVYIRSSYLFLARVEQSVMVQIARNVTKACLKDVYCHSNNLVYKRRCNCSVRWFGC